MQVTDFPCCKAKTQNVSISHIVSPNINLISRYLGILVSHIDDQRGWLFNLGIKFIAKTVNAYWLYRLYWHIDTHPAD
ncbi:MAG: hypothetical protein ACJAWL_000681 [Motiliproteus sp.]|jgi:hypothetical protein